MEGGLSKFWMPFNVNLIPRFSVLSSSRLSVHVSSRNQNRTSGLKSLGIGIGTETQTLQVSEMGPESKAWYSKAQNRNLNRYLMSEFLQQPAAVNNSPL